MLLNPILAAEALGLDTSTPEWQEVRAVERDVDRSAADALLMAGPCADAIERAARTRAVERYPLRLEFCAGERVSVATARALAGDGPPTDRAGERDGASYWIVGPSRAVVIYTTGEAYLCAPVDAEEALERVRESETEEGQGAEPPEIEPNDGGSDDCPPAATRHVLAGCLVLELVSWGGFRYGTPPAMDEARRSRVPIGWPGHEDYPDADDYAIAHEVMEFYLGASTTRDPEGPSNGSVAETVEQARAALDLAIRLLCDERPLAEIVADAAATVLHDAQGNRREQRDRANRDAARARRMLRVIAPKA